MEAKISHEKVSFSLILTYIENITIKIYRNILNTIHYYQFYKTYKCYHDFHIYISDSQNLELAWLAADWTLSRYYCFYSPNNNSEGDRGSVIYCHCICLLNGNSIVFSYFHVTHIITIIHTIEKYSNS